MEIVIHIGHGKTGTSAIQSFLARNVDDLLKQGVVYPSHSSFELAKLGKISSGNGLLLLEDFNFDVDSNFTYLFSNESLFTRFNDKDSMQAILDRLPVVPKFIIYTRDLFDLYFSAWGQSIKRRGGTKSLDEYVNEYKPPYAYVYDYIKLSEEFNFEFEIFNYSRHSDSLVEHFLKTVLPDVEIKEFDLDVGVVNRSLTFSEYKVQQLFNKFLKMPSHSFISDQLVNELPNLNSENQLVFFESEKELIDLSGYDIELVNSFLNKEEKISLKKPSYFTTVLNDRDKYEFTAQQLEVLIESISRVMKDNLSRALDFNDAGYLRDISLKYETGKDLSLKDAVNLMKLASKAHPKGPFIKAKLKEFSSLLSQ